MGGGKGFFEKREYGKQGAEFKVHFYGNRELRLLSVLFILHLCLFVTVVHYLNTRVQVLSVVFSASLWLLVFLRLYKSISQESVLVLADYGIQITKTFLFGNSASQFIPIGDIDDVVINEGVASVHHVKCYLAVLQKNKEGKSKLCPVFTCHDLPLTTLKEIYSVAQKKLFEREATD